MGTPANPPQGEVPPSEDQGAINLRLEGEKLRLEAEKLRRELDTVPPRLSRSHYVVQVLKYLPAFVGAVAGIAVGVMYYHDGYYKALEELNQLRFEKAQRLQEDVEAQQRSASAAKNSADQEFAEAQKESKEAKETVASAVRDKSAALHDKAVALQLASAAKKNADAQIREAQSEELAADSEELAASVRGASEPMMGELDMSSLDRARDSAFRAWHLGHSESARKAIIEDYSLPIRQFGHTVSEGGEGAAFSPDGQFVVTVDGLSGTLWNTSTGELVRRLPVADNRTVGAATNVGFSLDGSRVLVGGRGTVTILDTNSGRRLGTFPTHDFRAARGVFSSDGDRVLLWPVGDRGTMEVRNALDGSQLISMRACDSDLADVEFSHDGTRVVSACTDGTVWLWDATSGKQMLQMKGRLQPSNSQTDATVAFSRDGTRIIGVGRLIAMIWNAANGESIRTLGNEESAEFSPDPASSFVLVAGRSSASILDAETGTLLHELKWSGGFAGVAHFSPDGKRVITPTSDGTARVWDAATGKQLATLNLFCHGFGKGRLSNDGGFALSSGGGCVTELYRILPAEDIDKAFP